MSNDEKSLNDTIPIPQTREEALEAIAELDAQRWGESERAASRRLHEGRSYGLLLTTLAHRTEYDFGAKVPHLVAAAEAARTIYDVNELCEGG